MWNYATSYGRIRLIALVLLFFSLSVSSAHGSSMTTEETKAYMKVPTQQWAELMTLWNEQDKELNLLSAELKRLRKPSTELQQQLQKAQGLLTKSQEELASAKSDLNLLSSDMAELRTSCATLKQQIDKERRVYRRQLWQNRLWFFLIGAGAGYAIGKS